MKNNSKGKNQFLPGTNSKVKSSQMSHVIAKSLVEQLFAQVFNYGLA